MSEASKPTISPLYRICVNCGRVDDLVILKRQDGSRLMMCRDGGSCTRRRMAMDGVRLLDHPKNPEVECGS